MRRWWVLACAVLSGCALLGRTSAPVRAPILRATGAASADAPIDLALPTHPSRTRWKLSDWRGKVVLLDVWATWCEPCRESLPLYRDLAAAYRAKGVEVALVNVDADWAGVAPFLESLGVELPVMLDPGGLETEQTLKVRLMPTAYLIDRKGFVRHVHEGLEDDQLSKVVSQLDALLAESP